jgi:hypothetical protein
MNANQIGYLIIMDINPTIYVTNQIKFTQQCVNSKIQTGAYSAYNSIQNKVPVTLIEKLNERF